MSKEKEEKKLTFAEKLYKKVGAPPLKYDPYGLQLPFRMCIYGPSSAGKNAALLELISEWAEKDTFKKIIFVTKTDNQYIYKWFKKNVDPEYYEFMKKTPNIEYEEGEECSIEEDTLIVLDDQILDKGKGSNRVNNDKLFAFGRPNGISVCFLTQIYGGKEGLDAATRRNISACLFTCPKDSDRRTLVTDMDLPAEIITSAEDGKWILVNNLIKKKDKDRIKILDFEE